MKENHELKFVEVIEVTAFNLFGESYDVDSTPRHVIPVSALVYIIKALLGTTFYLRVRRIGITVLTFTLRRLSAKESPRVDLSFIELSWVWYSEEGRATLV